MISAIFAALTLAVAVLHGLYVNEKRAEYEREMQKALTEAAKGPGPAHVKMLREMEETVLSMERLLEHQGVRIIDLQESLDARFNRMSARMQRDKKQDDVEAIRAQIAGFGLETGGDGGGGVVAIPPGAKRIGNRR